MSIWTCKARVLAFLTIFGVAACDELPQSFGSGAKPVNQISMAGGDVKLATPSGYCIDTRTTRDRFALIGRCDTLGVEGFFNAWELAIITVSITRVAAGTTNPRAADLAAAPGAGTVLSSVQRESNALVQMRLTATSLEGVGDVYWRTAFVIGDELISATLYAPPESAALGREGARILENMVQKTRAASRRPPA